MNTYNDGNEKKVESSVEIFDDSKLKQSGKQNSKVNLEKSKPPRRRLTQMKTLKKEEKI